VKNGFFKVSLGEYASSRGKEKIEVGDEWRNIELPTRSTQFAAGYDFHTPISLEFPRDNGIVVSLGVCASIPSDEVLLIMPRSGLGFKYGMRLANTVGVIDSDYFNADNEGHIKVKIVCDKPCSLKAGDRICQGIIVKYSTFEGETSVETKRVGGFGSTDKK